MPYRLTQAAVQATLRSATDLVFLETLTFTHPDQAEPLRFVNDKIDLEWDNETYLAYPFDIKFPAQNSDTPPRIEITIAVIDQQVMRALRSLAGNRISPKITFAMTTRQYKKTEFGPSTFNFESVSTKGYASATIHATFLQAALDDQFPYLNFNPSNASAN